MVLAADDSIFSHPWDLGGMLLKKKKIMESQGGPKEMDIRRVVIKWL